MYTLSWRTFIYSHKRVFRSKIIRKEKGIRPFIYIALIYLRTPWIDWGSWCIYVCITSRIRRKPTLWNLRKISIRISLSMLRRLTRTDTWCFLWILGFRNRYFIPISLWDGMCRSGLAGRSWLIHNAESIMFVFSWNGSYVLYSWAGAKDLLGIAFEFPNTHFLYKWSCN